MKGRPAKSRGCSMRRRASGWPAGSTATSSACSSRRRTVAGGASRRSLRPRSKRCSVSHCSSSGDSWGVTDTCACAWPARNRRVACGSSACASAGRQAMLTRAWANWRSACAVAAMRSRPTYERSTSSCRASARAVGCRRPRTRSNRRNCSTCSSRASSRLTVGCEVCSDCAARVTWPVAITARKNSICRWVSCIGQAYQL